jgi:hypothetical protein
LRNENESAFTLVAAEVGGVPVVIEVVLDAPAEPAGGGPKRSTAIRAIKLRSAPDRRSWPMSDDGFITISAGLGNFGKSNGESK